MMYPPVGSSAFNLLKAVALNPHIQPHNARAVYSGGRWRSRLEKWNATLVDGGYYLDADLRDWVLQEIEKPKQELVKPRQINVMSSPPLPVANRNWSMRVGALDYQNMASHYA